MATTRKTSKENSVKELSEQQVKHLEFIQDVIKRFASNSFQIKGWMLTIVSALLGFLANSGEKSFALVAILPALVFWGLDAYYLQQERKIRGIYKDVVNPEKARIKVGLFEIPMQNYAGGKYSFWDVFLSRTMLRGCCRIESKKLSGLPVCGMIRVSPKTKPRNHSP